MSGHYSCGQYNDAFNARRLGNWQYRVNCPEKCSQRKSCTTEFIADCNGHLLPHINRTYSSPWGDFRTCVWEESTKCHSSERFRNSQDYEHQKLPKFFKKQPPQPKPPSKRPRGVKPAIDPILNTLRERRLPVIWMIGLSTHKIQRLREKFCEELSGALDYVYINLDYCIANWRRRHHDMTFNEEQDEPSNYPGMDPYHQQRKSFGINASNQNSAIYNEDYDDQSSVSIPATLSPSLLDLVVEYDKTPNRTALAYATHINTQRQGRQSRSRQIRQSCSKICMTSTTKQYDPITGDEIGIQQPGHLIQFSLGQRFTRDKIMELLKFAMIESYPTKGYIIDGIFLDPGDGLCFEKMFYGPAVCTYFTESMINNTIDEWNRVRRGRPPAQDLIVDRQIKSEVELIFPRFVRRNKKYSFLEVDKLCQMFETKMIRVLNAEEANQETINFVYSLLYKHIKNYPNQISEESKIQSCDHESEKEEESDSFLSPVHSAMTVSQSKVDKPESTLTSLTLDPINEEFQRMIARQLPVIWILGLKQVSTDEIRKKFCEMLAQQMNFTFIKMDEEIIKWYDPIPQNQLQENVSKVRIKVREKAHRLAKKIVDKNGLLSQEEVIELIKYSLMLAHPTNGYIINEFPVNMAEGDMFEKQIYPSTSLIYFLNFTWTVNKSIEPSVEIPQYFRRSETYSEEKVEKVCDLNGYKAVKVWNAEDLDVEGIFAINNIIQECINNCNNLDGGGEARRFNPYEGSKSPRIISNRIPMYISPPTAFRLPLTDSTNLRQQKQKERNVKKKKRKSPIINTKYTRRLQGKLGEEIIEEIDNREEEENLVESPPRTPPELEIEEEMQLRGKSRLNEGREGGGDGETDEDINEEMEDLTHHPSFGGDGSDGNEGDDIIDMTENEPPDGNEENNEDGEEKEGKLKNIKSLRSDGRGDF